MNFLAFETSSETLSIAVSRGEETYAEDIAGAGQKNAELALPLMHKLLNAAALSLNEIDVIVFGQGPGAFTGVRIACGLAQGLAYGLEKRVIQLPSTLALATQAHASGAHEKIVVAIDARMGEVYFAAYEHEASADTGFIEIVAPMLCKPDAMPVLDGAWCGIGSVFADTTLREAVLRNAHGAIRTIVETPHPQATFLLNIAKHLYEKRGVVCTVAPADAEPLYLRNHVALTIKERQQIAAAKTKVAA